MYDRRVVVRPAVFAAVMLSVLAPARAMAQGTVPLVKTPSLPSKLRMAIEAKSDTLSRMLAAYDIQSVTQGSGVGGNPVREGTSAVARLTDEIRKLVASTDTLTCSVTGDPGAKLCGVRFGSATARKAGEIFWNQEDNGGFTAAKMINVQGLGDLRGQKTYVELVSDLWNLTRISLGGVFKSGDSTSDKSKAQQFLAGGGPAVITLLRPIAVANIANSHSVLLGRGQVSFTVPGQEETADDSLKFGTVGLDMQTSIQGDSKKIGGLLLLHGGQVFGGKAFYHAMDEKDSFFATSVSLGIVVEEAASLMYTRFLTGPGPLTGTRDLIGVKFTR